MKTLLAALLLLVATPVQANTIYSYAGNTFTMTSGEYTTADFLRGSFTYADGFGPVGLLTGCEVDACADGHAGLLSWSFSDGHQSLTEGNSGAGRMIWSVTSWLLDFSNALGRISTRFGISGYEDAGDTAVGFGNLGSICNHGLCSNQGTWMVETVTVPELAILPRLPRLLKFGLGLGLEDKITARLQRITAWGAATILGVPRDGIVLTMPRVRVEVIEACSGFQTLLFMLVVAGLIAATGRFTCDRMFLHAIACWSMLVVVAVLLALEANALRVAVTALGLDWTAGTMAHGWKMWIQYATTGLAVGQLVGVARLCRTF